MNTAIGQVEVAVLLHVEVDELLPARRGAARRNSGVSDSTTCATASSNAQGECGATVDDTLIDT